ncbi:DUF6801 domain-containing protein [Actinokineospora cianjurensis]|uniref:DUF6801 domain-containing protein n=1 Tax=Actinokineospora cianjurensis TaxID=585224 RepID=A0A421AWG1_9PSEU|nr:DUF6801 domain-containing protein [Actinokineospora cianjurensis]RLK54160.1 hypothetical protein CLV68_6162 [Actinokineospora cianjurensis]
MNPAKISRTLVAAVAGTGAVGLVAAGLLLGSGAGVAEPVSLTLNYTCPFPLIGNQAIKVVISSDIPATIGVGEPTGAFDITAITTVPDTATQGLTLVGAATVEGKAVSGASVAAPGVTVPVNVPITVEKTPVPASGAFDVKATGQTPSLTFAQAGTAKISVNELTLTLTPKKADGTLTGLGTFDSPCTLNPGQDNTLHTFQITGGTTQPTTTTTTPSTPTTTATTTTPPITTTPTTTPPTTTTTPTSTTPTTSSTTPTTTTAPPTTTTPPTTQPTTTTTTPPTTTTPTTTSATPTSTTPPTTSTSPTTATTTPTTTRPPGPGVKVDYDLTGSSNLKALKGSVALTGGFSAEADLAAGRYTGRLALNPTSGRFTILGFLPATAAVAFEQVGTAGGALSTGAITFAGKLDIKLTRIAVLGLPVYQGDTCKTVTPSDVTLTSSGPFDVLKGGKLTGGYDLGKVSGCGKLNNLIAPLITSKGNTIDVTLAIKK